MREEQEEVRTFQFVSVTCAHTYQRKRSRRLTESERLKRKTDELCSGTGCSALRLSHRTESKKLMGHSGESNLSPGSCTMEPKITIMA